MSLVFDVLDVFVLNVDTSGGNGKDDKGDVSGNVMDSAILCDDSESRSNRLNEFLDDSRHSTTLIFEEHV